MRRHAVLPALLLLAADPVEAQRPQAPLAPAAEFRLAAPLTPSAGLQAGLGGEIRAGWYSRIGVGVTMGVAHRPEEWVPVASVALTARFLFDPFGERPLGLYGGAGLGQGSVGGRSSPAVLLLLAGVEGAAQGRVIPALEVVLGGGVRVQGVLRLRRDVGR
jgi:hypothetical protein